MRQKGRRKGNIESLLALLLFGVFAVCVLSVLLTGAGAYSRLTKRDQTAYEERTCVQYLATKVRQAPEAGAVSLSAFGDGDALVFTEEIGGAWYTTQIYCSGGWLRELFSAAGESFEPDAGEKIIEAQALELALEGNLLTIQITGAAGKDTQLTLALRGGEGAVP